MYEKVYKMKQGKFQLDLNKLNHNEDSQGLKQVA